MGREHADLNLKKRKNNSGINVTDSIDIYTVKIRIGI